MESTDQNRRHEALEQQNRRYANLLDSLLEFDQKLGIAASFDDLIKSLREQIALITSYDCFTLLMVQEDASFEVEAVNCRPGLECSGYDRALDQLIDDGTFSRAVRICRPLMARGIHADTLLSALTIGDDVRGMILLHGCPELGSRTLQVLHHLTRRTGVALAELLPSRGTNNATPSPQQDDERSFNRHAFDSLTGLYRRSEWMAGVSNQLSQYSDENSFSAGILINLDGYWRMNLHFGDRLGNSIVKYIANRLRQTLGSPHVENLLGGEKRTISIARTGQDEFAIFISQVSDREGFDELIPHLHKELSEGFVFGGTSVYATASMGISLYPFDAADASSLIQHADIALKHAKRTGRDKYVYYTEEMQQLNAIGLGLEQVLHRSLQENLFFFHYQPQIKVCNGEIYAMEALLRMRGEDQQLISPAIFIPLAERIGLARKIGEWGLREVCRQIKSWQKAGLQVVPVSVNLSAQQLNQATLVDVYSRIIADEGVSPHHIELEITETTISHDKEQAVENIHKLHQAGFRIILDDFGTGYSTLAFLNKLPVDGIKIDKMFVSEMTTDKRSAGIVLSLVEMAHRLNITIIAEGVEEREQLEQLNGVGCPLAQGFLIARPQPADVIASGFLSPAPEAK